MTQQHSDCVILGVDPGSRITGYGIIHVSASRQQYVASGCIRVEGNDMHSRLFQIYENLSELVESFKPQEAAIEQVFMNQNVSSALKLGQARGAAIVAVAKRIAFVTEYSPRQVKQAVVGYGGAKKEQVQHMVKVLLNLSGTPKPDAADALAVALCHAQMRRNVVNPSLARRKK